MINRRTFLETMALSSGAMMCPKAFGASARKCNYGALLHLGSNMWSDYAEHPGQYAQSAEEELTRPNPLDPTGKRVVAYHSYLQCRDDLWRELVDHAAKCGLNQIFIDLGEGVEYPSHPELKVPGTWSVEKLRKELKRMRKLGIEPLPKLNFSTCHDSWLKDYHRMVSTPIYYQVVADLIKDVCEIFDHPNIFHIGFDEELPVAGKSNHLMVVRQGDLWWHDLEYTIKEVEKNGSRALMWSDAICAGREEFLKRMSRGVLQAPWYYFNIAEKDLVWREKFEKQTDTWAVQRNLLASFIELDKAGFDLYPFTSNWGRDDAAEGMVKFCRERLNPDHVKGIYTASWCNTVPEKHDKGMKCIDLFAKAIKS